MTAAQMGSIEQAQYAEQHPTDKDLQRMEEMGLQNDSDEEAFDSIRQQHQMVRGDGHMGNDDMVVPMHGKDQIIDFHTVDESTYQLGDPEEEEKKNKNLKHPRITTLPISQRTCAEKLAPYVGGEEVPCLMFSSKWNQREEGVKRFSEMMSLCFIIAKEVEKQEQIDKKDDDVVEQSHGLGLTHEQKCNQAILQSMGEVLKDKVH